MGWCLLNSLNSIGQEYLLGLNLFDSWLSFQDTVDLTIRVVFDTPVSTNGGQRSSVFKIKFTNLFVFIIENFSYSLVFAFLSPMPIIIHTYLLAESTIVNLGFLHPLLCWVGQAVDLRKVESLHPRGHAVKNTLSSLVWTISGGGGAFFGISVWGTVEP